ncbi:MAG: TPM domain-containing protein [Caldimonas sp.]
MQSRWVRLLKHRLRDEGDAKRLLGEAALARIASRVSTSEMRHSGEIRVCVEGGLPLSYLRRDATARDRAVAMFGKLKVWDTEHNNGVLIYLLLAEHAIEIVADRGLNEHVDPAEWKRITESMTSAFKAHDYESGLNQAIDAVDALLVRRFPLAPGDPNPNELPDAPYTR